MRCRACRRSCDGSLCLVALDRSGAPDKNVFEAQFAILAHDATVAIVCDISSGWLGSAHRIASSRCPIGIGESPVRSSTAGFPEKR